MRAIPIRKRILELYDQGKSTREIAQFSGFCIAAVRRVRQQFRERRRLEPRTSLCGRKTLLTEERKQRLRHLLTEQPDATLAELGAGLDRPFRTSTIDLWLRWLGWKYKKTLAAAEQERPDVAARRAHWHEQFAAEPTAPLVFVDESGQHQDDAPAGPRAGWAKTVGAHSPWTLSDQHLDLRDSSGGPLRSLAF